MFLEGILYLILESCRSRAVVKQQKEAHRASMTQHSRQSGMFLLRFCLLCHSVYLFDSNKPVNMFLQSCFQFSQKEKVSENYIINKF